MSQPFKRATHSFIVRFWPESSDQDDGQLSGQVERVGSGEKAHFRGAEGLLKLLERWTPNFTVSEQQPQEEQNEERENENSYIVLVSRLRSDRNQ